MKRIAPAVLLAVIAASCGSSTTSNDGTTPGVDPTPPDPAVDSAPPTTTAPVTDTTVPTDSSVDTTTIDPVVTEPAATAAPEPEPAPETTAAPPAPPTTLAPTSQLAVVYGGSGTPGIPWVPLGWWDGSAWNPGGYNDDGSFIVVPDATIATVGATSLDLPDGPSQVVDSLSLGAEDFYCIGDEMGPVIDLGLEVPTTPVSLGYDAIAVTADWPLQPRPVTQVGIENPEYQTVGASLLAEVPTSDLGTVSQVVRVDLDGDGVEEVLVTYQYLTEPNFGAENDFSAVYLRTPAADGTVTDQIVVEYVLDAPTDFPTVGRFSIAAVADLNGDGVMEVATRSQFWESAGITIWEFADGTLTEIGGGGCGV